MATSGLLRTNSRVSSINSSGSFDGDPCWRYLSMRGRGLARIGTDIPAPRRSSRPVGGVPDQLADVGQRFRGPFEALGDQPASVRRRLRWHILASTAERIDDRCQHGGRGLFSWSRPASMVSTIFGAGGGCRYASMTLSVPSGRSLHVVFHSCFLLLALNGPRLASFRFAGGESCTSPPRDHISRCVAT